MYKLANSTIMKNIEKSCVNVTLLDRLLMLHFKLCCSPNRALIKCYSGQAVEQIRSAESLQFDFETIKIATDDFSDANKLGRGGFGVVYKVLLHY